jgi:ubiquitin-protein ligase
MGQHTADSTLDHLDLLVTTKTNMLRNEFDNKIETLKAEHDGQVRALKSEHQNEIIHSRLSSFCRKWMERKPDALFDFVVYRENSGLTTRLLCGIPGPKRTPWEGGLFPVLMTRFSDPDRAPNCKYPKGFHHVNVYPLGWICAMTLFVGLGWHREISIPELLYIFQDYLAHPNPDSPQQVPAFLCYRDNIEEYNTKAKKHAEFYYREDFLQTASVGFGLDPKGWILVTDTVGGGVVDEHAPTAQAPPVEPTMGNENKRDCSCSCCAWGYSSYWDGLREMRFLRGKVEG